MYRIMIKGGADRSFRPHLSLPLYETKEEAIETLRGRQEHYPDFEYAVRWEDIGPIEVVERLNPADEAWEAYVNDVVRGRCNSLGAREGLEAVKEYFMEGFERGKNG